MGKDKKIGKKKEKITYIDDGRTIADMSAVGGARSRNTGKTPSERDKRPDPRLLPGGRSTMREQAQTYLDAVRTMFLPMLVVIGILCLAFLIVWFLL